MGRRRNPTPAGTQWDPFDLLARLERAGCTDITTKAWAVYFTTAGGVPSCFPYKLLDRASGTDYLVAGPGTGSKLEAAYEAGTGIISEYALVRFLGLYKEHPLYK